VNRQTLDKGAGRFLKDPSLAQICSKGKSGVGVSVPIVICYLVKAILLFLQHE